MLIFMYRYLKSRVEIIDCKYMGFGSVYIEYQFYLLALVNDRLK